MLRKFFTIFLLLILLAPSVAGALTLEELKAEVEKKQQEMKQLDERINVYKKNIESKQNEAVTLSNQVAIIKSRTIKIELDIRMTEAQIEVLNLEISSLENEIEDRQAKILKDVNYIGSLIRSIHVEDQRDYLSIILQNPSFSEYFNQVAYLEDINNQIDNALKQVKTEKTELETKQSIAKVKRDKIVELARIQNDQKASLGEQQQTKNYLLTQTKMSEAKFRLLLEQVRQDQMNADKELASLQKKIENQLSKNDQTENLSSDIGWPARPTKGISTYFRDPTYPFRYLFEHSGIDLAIKAGTPLGAAASGYVAWARTSKSYGNNIMIIHSDGLATLYAHLSRFNTVEGAFVKKGEIIAYSGGTPGTPGAGFSTGAHLHFEVRLHGVPVDPMDYLKY